MNKKKHSYMGVSFWKDEPNSLHYNLEYESIRAYNELLDRYATDKEFKEKVNKETDFFIVEIELQGLLLLHNENFSLAYAYYKAKDNQEELYKLAVVIKYCDDNGLKYTDYLQEYKGDIFKEEEFLNFYRKDLETEPIGTSVKNYYDKLDAVLKKRGNNGTKKNKNNKLFS